MYKSRNKILFVIILIYFTSFVVAHTYRVQGSSMNATLKDGDLIWVSKFFYNTSVENFKNKILIFKHPVSQSIFIKRCIATFKDTVRILDGKILINSFNSEIQLNQKSLYKIWYNDKQLYSEYLEKNGFNKFNVWNDKFKKLDTQALSYIEAETMQTKHFIDSLNILPDAFQFKSISDTTLILNSNSFFFIGDNIPFSNDSRHFGLITKENIIGKAKLVLFNYSDGRFQCERFFRCIY